MSPGQPNPLFPDPGPGYPKAAHVAGLPEPVPLGPITTPLPPASSCWHTTLLVSPSSHSFAVAAHAPVGSVLSYVLVTVTSTFTVNTFFYVLRGHNSLPTTLAQFLSGPLIFPTHINNHIEPDWATAPYETTRMALPLHIVLPQGAPLIVLGLINTGTDAEVLSLYLVIGPPPEPQP